MDDVQIETILTDLGERPRLTLPASLRPVIQLALATVGQWRTASADLVGTVPVALDLTALDVAARWLGLTPSPDLFDDIRTIEAEALHLMRTK